MSPVGCIVIREITVGCKTDSADIIRGLEKLFEDPDKKIGGDTAYFLEALRLAGLLEVA